MIMKTKILTLTLLSTLVVMSTQAAQDDWMDDILAAAANTASSNPPSLTAQLIASSIWPSVDRQPT